MLLATLALAVVTQVDPTLPRQVMASISAEHCRADVETLVSFGTRHTLSDAESPTRGVGAARRWIGSEFESISAANGGRLVVSFEEFDIPKGPRMPREVRAINVVGVLPGTDPEQAGRRYYVVGHYDSRNGDANDAAGDAPGANDDASGTAVVIECARALAPHRFPATIVFLATVAEEQGLFGARYHADQARSRGEQILGVLNNDIVGDPLGPFHPRTLEERAATPPPGSGIPVPAFAQQRPELAGVVRVFSEGIPRNASAETLARIRGLAAESDSPSRQLARYVAEVAALEGAAVRPKLVFRLDRFLRGGDHSAFNDAGFPAVRFSVPVEEFDRQHQNVRTERRGLSAHHFGDTPDYCDFEYLAGVARLNAATLVHLASAPPPPSRIRIVTAKLENSTTLRWAQAKGAVGYEVVWRETTAWDWTGSIAAGDLQELVIDKGKDDLFFGVRSVGPTGFRSPAWFADAGGE